MANVDEISPLSVGSERFRLTPADPLTPPRAFDPYSITVDYSLADPEGVVLPLELIVTSPSGAKKTYFRRLKPPELTIHPDEGGVWLVTLREVAHNRYWGRLSLEVTGDRFS